MLLVWLNNLGMGGGGAVVVVGERFSVYRGIGVGGIGVSDKTSVGQEHVSINSED